MAWLCITGGVHSGAVLHLLPGTWTIGPDLDSDIVLVDLPTDTRFRLTVTSSRIELCEILSCEYGAPALVELDRDFLIGPVRARCCLLAPSLEKPGPVRAIRSEPFRPGHRRKRNWRIGVPLATACMLAGAPVCSEEEAFLRTTGPSATRSSPALAMIDEFATQPALHDLRVDATEPLPLVTGVLASAKEVDDAREIVRARWGSSVRFRVAVLEKVKADMEAAAGAMKLPLTVALEGRGLRLSGLVWEDDDHDRFLALFDDELRRGVAVDDCLVTRRIATDAVARLADGAGLRSPWSLDRDTGGIAIKVLLADREEEAGWSRVLEQLAHALGPVLAKTEMVRPPVLPPVEGIRLERRPSLLLLDGRELGIGAKLADGLEIVGIDREGVQLRREERIVKARYVSGPRWIAWAEGQ